LKEVGVKRNVVLFVIGGNPVVVVLAARKIVGGVGVWSGKSCGVGGNSSVS
jgi:hypothetical protein